MLNAIEMNQVDPDFKWIEVQCFSESHKTPILIRLLIGDRQEMICDFIKKYQAKAMSSEKTNIAVSALTIIEEFFQEAAMAKGMVDKQHLDHDLVTLLPTTVINFQYPEKTSFRKSKSVRISLFLDEARDAMSQYRIQNALNRLEWVHQLDPKCEEAFSLKIICLRSARKFVDCVAVFEKWIEADPGNTSAHLGLGELWLFLAQNAKAKERFEILLQLERANPLALLGLAQAKAKLKEPFKADVRKAAMLDGVIAKDVVEHTFDFRTPNPQDLQPLTLVQIADMYQIPLKRVVSRAQFGVLPMHLPENTEALPRFSKWELDRHYEVLNCLGLEINTASLANKPLPKITSPDQPGLFDE